MSQQFGHLLNKVSDQQPFDLEHHFEAEFGAETLHELQKTLCPQKGMKQQSVRLLNHIRTHPIKQWSTKLGPKSRHKAHSWAIESSWPHPLLLHHAPHGPESMATQRGIHRRYHVLIFRPSLHADRQNLQTSQAHGRFLHLVSVQAQSCSRYC